MEDDLEAGSLSSVVARADALMQRRRQSQSPAESEDLPVLTEVVDPDADLPVLIAEAVAEPPPAAETSPALPDPAVLDILAYDLARRLGERLAAEIPGLVAAALESALARATEEIRRGLADCTESALRDLLAEEETLPSIRQPD